MSLFKFSRSYSGPLQGVILDWAGTTIDYGCFAPLVVFIEIFKKRGIEISVDEARGPMGMHKRDHIQTILTLPDVQKRWVSKFQRAPSIKDIDELFTDFVPMQLACLKNHAQLIPGVKKTIDQFRERKLKIGSTTGYTSQMMEIIFPIVKEQGFLPDAVVCANEVSKARPAPFMCFQNAMKLGIYPMESLVKIGDTPVDVEEGLNAGAWTIAVAKTGNQVGLLENDFNKLSEHEKNQKLTWAYRSLNEAGAHYVVDELSDVLPLLDVIEARLKRGEKP